MNASGQQNQRADRCPLSIFIITKNEEKRLGATLAAIKDLADEIIVVDSGSTDDTVEIARSHGAKCITNAPFPGYGPQKSIAEKACKNDWVLNLDADEVVSPQLRDEIFHFFAGKESRYDLVRLKIVDMLPGETKKPPLAYTVSPVRLYRKSIAAYGNDLVHDRVHVSRNARATELEFAILHYPIVSFSGQLEKLLTYSSLQATDLHKKERRLSKLRLYTELPGSFFKYYFSRRFFMRGRSGFMAACNYAIFRYVRLLRSFEKQ